MSSNGKASGGIPFGVDLHVDTLSRAVALGLDPNAGDWPSLHVDADRARRGGVRAFLTACFTPDDCAEPAAEVERMLDYADALDAGSGPWLKVATAGELAALEAGAIGMIPTIENARSLEGSPERIERWFARGVRVLGVTWNGANDLASGVGAEEDLGLTPWGREAIAIAIELGMAIDISHLAPLGVEQLLEQLLENDGAVLATHSNAAALWPHRRNLTDAQLRALGAADGLVGINLYPSFLGEGTVDLECVAAHVSHVAELVGVERVAIGTDFDGIDRTPEGIPDVSALPRLDGALRAAGFSDHDVAGVRGENFVRWWRRRGPA